MLTGKNICKFLLVVRYGIKTAIAIIGVMFAGSMNLLKRIQPSNKPALLKNSFAGPSSVSNNLKETFRGIFNVLSDDGVLVIEDPSLLKVLQNNSYDQFYDEHVYVFSSISINNIIKEYGLRLFDVENLPTHGGSNRYYICKKDGRYKKSSRLEKSIKSEISYRLHKIESYLKFSKRVSMSKKNLFNLIKRLKKKDKKIISYGATYKSTTVFNYCNFNSKIIDYVTDTTLNKQGKYTPGTHIKIISPKHGMNNTVDYAFLGAWNFKKEIFKKEKNFFKRGGKFITHVPRVMTLSK